MSGYTPGPWIVEESDFDDSILITTADMSGAFVPVAAVSTGYTGPIEDEQLANIRLIAAAPELLEALIALLPYTEDITDQGPCCEGWKSANLSLAIATAESAIRKATEAAS